MYIYIDDTVFKKNESELCETHGIGVAIANSPISSLVVSEALDKLQNDPDIKKQITFKQDMRTLSNGYFHASEDSQNGHSHFCSSIRRNINGDFNAYYIDDNHQHIKSDWKRECLHASLLKIVSSRQKVTLIFESGHDFTKTYIEESIKKLFSLIRSSMSERPNFKTYFPVVEVIEKGKDEPGLQVVDFILWTINQKYKNKSDDKWFRNIFRDESGNSHGAVSMQYIYDGVENFGVNIGTAFRLKSEPQIHTPVIEIEYEINKILNSYKGIEQRIKGIKKSDFNQDSLHFLDCFLAIKRLFQKNESIWIDDIERLLELYINLFDQLPLYSVDNDPELERLLLARKVASFLLDKRQINSINSLNYIAKYRDENLSEFL